MWTSVITGLICLALLATVLEYSLLVGDRVALRDLDSNHIDHQLIITLFIIREIFFKSIVRPGMLSVGRD